MDPLRRVFLRSWAGAQFALAMRFCDATALITAVGWDPDTVSPDAETFEVPLTDDLIEQLRHRRYDLALTNNDRLPEHKPIRPRPSPRSGTSSSHPRACACIGTAQRVCSRSV
jgi:hypothetical protein